MAHIVRSEWRRRKDSIGDSRRPRLKKLLMANVPACIVIAAVVSVALLLTDKRGISTLMNSDTSPTLSAFVFFMNGIVMFAMLMAATAIWLHD